MILGPEFHRNIWIRFSFFSLILMPFLIGSCLLLVFVSHVFSNDYDVIPNYKNLQYLAMYKVPLHWSEGSLNFLIPILFLVLFVLGSYEASTSYTSELRNKTWDLQKISAIRPIHLMIGKLFGVTSYTWYFSLGLLSAILYAYSNTFKDVTPNLPIGTLGPQQPLLLYPSLIDVFLLGLCFILSAFSGHLAATICSASNLRNKSMRTAGSLIIGICVSVNCLKLLLSIFGFFYLDGSFLTSDSLKFAQTLFWFGYEIDVRVFVFVTFSFFILWGLVCLFRFTRSELNFQSFPFVWLLFLLWCSLYITGLLNNSTYHHNGFEDKYSIRVFLYSSFLIYFFATYCSLYQSATDIGAYMKFKLSFNDRDYKRMLETIPRWILTVAFCFILLAVLLPFEILEGSALNLRDFSLGKTNGSLILGNVFLSFLIFLVRDGLVMHLCLLGNRFKRGGLMLAVFYLVAYGILPALLLIPITRTSPSDGFYIAALFYPLGIPFQPIVMLGLLLQISIPAYLLWKYTASYRLK